MTQRALVAATLAALCLLAQAQQRPIRDELGADGMEALKQLRLKKLQSAADDIAIDAQLKKRVLDTGDERLLAAVLRDRALLESRKLNQAVSARAAMFEVARLAATDANVAAALKLQDVDVDKVRQDAVEATDPEKARLQLAKRLGTDPKGRLLLRAADVLVTRPEPIADDSLAPGQISPTSPHPKPIWRSGLKFAALLGARRSGSHAAVCSATIIGSRWAVTAAHCLLNRQTGTRFDTQTLAVFLPFQGGAETVVGPNGADSRSMRRVRIDAMFWIGEVTNDIFPSDADSFSGLIAQGKDLALLQLNSADTSSLASPIADVRLLVGAPVVPPVSMVGYGITDLAPQGDLALLVGVRAAPPNGIEEKEPLLVYGPNKGEVAGGTCGGDSGGGLFAGRMDGTVAQPRLIGVVSGLSGTQQASSAGICMASQQNHTSLLIQRNRDFVCKRVPAACA